MSPSSTRRWTTRLALATWLFAAGAVVFGGACSSPNETAISPLALPDRNEFITSVSPFMEARCGSLDCHGNFGRPLRIFSQNGLRQSSGPQGARDNAPTRPEERLENYFATVGLEPEEISLSRVTEGAFTDFLLLKKPISIDFGGVRHKGGPVLRPTDSGFECLITWIAGKVDAAKCADASTL